MIVDKDENFSSKFFVVVKFVVDVVVVVKG